MKWPIIVIILAILTVVTIVKGIPGKVAACIRSICRILRLRRKYPTYKIVLGKEYKAILKDEKTGKEFWVLVTMVVFCIILLVFTVSAILKHETYTMWVSLIGTCVTGGVAISNLILLSDALTRADDKATKATRAKLAADKKAKAAKTAPAQAAKAGSKPTTSAAHSSAAASKAPKAAKPKPKKRIMVSDLTHDD